MKTNIVHFITGLNTGGAEMMLLKLLRVSDLDKYNILVVSLIDKGTIGKQIESLGIKVHTLNLSQNRPITISLLKLPYVLVKFKPNIFNCWMYHANLLASIISIFLSNVNVIWGVRHSLHDIKKEKFLTRVVINLSRYFSKKCKNIVFNSKVSLEQHVAYGFSKNNCSVIYNGFDSKHFSPERISNKQRNDLKISLKIPQNKMIVGYIARFHPMKGHKIFFNAIKKIINQKKDICFILVGPGITNEKINKLIPNEIRSFVYLLEERFDIAEINSIFDVAINCSLWGEGFSNTICESMLMEIPCIATNIGESEFILNNCGIVIDANDEQLLANSILNLLSMSSVERQKIGKLERLRILDNFSIEEIYNQYESLY